jgi:uncharacterized protein (DUF488 family)
MLHTIGFTKKSASEFFGLLRGAGVLRVLDVRLNRKSQLAGFAKEQDLRYFLSEIGAIELVVIDALAPTAELLNAYRSKSIVWSEYQESYRSLLVERRVHELIPRNILDGGCLLCSEHTAEKCHRRVAAEYLTEHFDDLQIRHL